MFEPISIDARSLRLRLNLNQTAFWGPVGVTQSGGSRYESGRKMPKAVTELVRLVHVEKVDLRRINAADLHLIAFLKKADPQLYKKLKAESREFK